MPQDPVDALTDVVVRLNDIWLPYMLTGSVAGRFYGLSRSTEDTDIVVDIQTSHIDEFVRIFSGDYYVDPAMVADSVRTGER